MCVLSPIGQNYDNYGDKGKPSTNWCKYCLNSAICVGWQTCLWFECAVKPTNLHSNACMVLCMVQANYNLLASKISSMRTHISQRERTLQPSEALRSTPLKCSWPSNSYDSSHSRITQSYSLMAACDMLLDVSAPWQYNA